MDDLKDDWFPVTYALNNLNRGLGLSDAYPFVLSTPAVEKLRVVHDTICEPQQETDSAIQERKPGIVPPLSRESVR